MARAFFNLEKFMARRIAPYTLARTLGHPQSVLMPRRAKITGIASTRTHVTVYAEVLDDADTTAFDTGRHQRWFVLVAGSTGIPEGAGLVGFHNGDHLYEVKTP